MLPTSCTVFEDFVPYIRYQEESYNNCADPIDSRCGNQSPSPQNVFSRLRTIRTASDDESRNLPAGDAARTEEFRRVGSEDAGREKDEEDEDSGAKEALESESRKVEGRSFFDPSIRATTEKLRLLVQSGKVIGRNTWLKRKMEIENSEAERIEKRPLVVQELRAAAEELKLQVRHSLIVSDL